MILYLTYWFPAHARGRAVARFMTATAIAGAIGSPLSGLLLEMDGIRGLGGWQWLFLIEGIPAVVLGFITFAYLPDGPQKAKWLNPEEKTWIAETLHRERTHAASGGQHSVGEALGSGRVWTFAIIYFAIIMSFYGVTFWLPQIVKALSGMSNFAVGFITAVPWIGRPLSFPIGK